MAEEQSESQEIESELQKIESASQEIEKVDEGPKRFVAKGPVVLDTKTGLTWMKKDSWQEKGKFMNWHEATDYALLKNVRKIGGFDDWRLPFPAEIEGLYDDQFENKGKSGITIHIDPVFPEGAYKTSWVTGDTSTRRPRFDFSLGKMMNAEEYSFGSVRICRKELVRKSGYRTSKT